MTSVSYFSRHDCLGQFFECAKLRGSVATDWCARQWYEVNQHPEGRRHLRWVSCSGCELGAKHAGVRHEQLPSALSEMRICARCTLESNRIIRGYLCVSCYNREREYRIGRNAKGTRPIKHPPLFDVKLRVFDSAKPNVDSIRVIEGCTSLHEAMLRVFMKVGAGVAVSPCA